MSYFIGMKNTSRKPYIYKVTNQETGQYYIGSQCSGKTIGVNYFTSSHNKEFKEGFKNYGEEKYKIEIIKEFTDPKECVEIENVMIRDHMLKKDGLCLNRAYFCNGEKIFSRLGTHHPLSEETKQKISKTKKGRPSTLKGTHLSEETKQKMSSAKKGLPVWNKGIPCSEETKQKISKAKKGTHHTEEARKKMREAQKGHPGWNKGIPHSEEAKQKISLASPRRIRISIEGTVFDSLTDASKYYNMSSTTIKNWAKTNKHNAVYIEK